MNKQQNVVEFYLLCNKLKDIIRTGWKTWNVKRKRVESIAEHIYGTQMLALAMWSEFKYDIDIKKVLFMLSVHELEEILIGDLSPFDSQKKNKVEMGHKAVHEVLKNLISKEEIENLVFEFDERKTKEATFANQCDKLECDIQCKIYDEEGCVDLKTQNSNAILKVKEVKKLIDNNGSWSHAWIKFWQNKANYDDNFSSVSNYLLNNKITK